MPSKDLSRRRFLGFSATVAGLALVPRRVLGGAGFVAPSETITRGVIGTGGQGLGGHVTGPPHTLAVCDVDKNHLANAMKKAGEKCTPYTDFRKLLERKDIDTVHIATPTHWHAVQCITAAAAGKDILCEKPFTRFIREGQAVADAVRRYGRVLQIGTYWRFQAENRRWRRLIASGILGTPVTVRASAKTGYFWKVKMMEGRMDLKPEPVPAVLDYDMWLGPAPFKPYHPHRVHFTWRNYWDYAGGGLVDMGEHFLDPIQYWLNKDETSPVEAEAYAPWPQHPDAVLPFGRVTLKYADGTKLILESGEWGEQEPGEVPFIEGPKGRIFSPHRRGDNGNLGGKCHSDPPGLLDEPLAVPEPEPLVNFEQGVRTRRQPGGNADASYRCVALMHLGTIACRVGRKIRFDPVAGKIVGDEEANRFVDLPLRAPWHL